MKAKIMGYKKKFGIIVGICTILMFVLSVNVFFFLSIGDEHSTESSSDTALLSEPNYLKLGNFTLTLRDGYTLKANIELMISEPATVEYLSARLILVVDTVVRELRKISSEDAMHPEEILMLKKRLQIVLHQLLPKNSAWDDPKPIRKVLITKTFYIM